MPQPLLFLGIMSGSSLDGIDVALVELDTTKQQHCKLLATHFSPYGSALKEALLALHFPQENELEKSALMANQLAALYAGAVNHLLDEHQLKASQVAAIGCHGQTIRHQPQSNVNESYTIQLSNHALLAELTGINVVGDFRSRDLAAGGQGAPLVPAFHQAVFGSDQLSRAIVNIGGIANISYLDRSGTVTGFDTGPGNLLLDNWAKQHIGKSYDANGAWASTGNINQTLLSAMLADQYFALPPPKSTGRDLFNATWLVNHLENMSIKNEDVARTLVALTATSIAADIQRHCSSADGIYICGGGAHNQLLINDIQQLLASTPVDTTNALGVDVDWVEAVAFAWLAQQAMSKQTGNLPAVTGAQGPRILGAIYPA